MNRIIEFWYEFASTYSYPAAMRVEDVAARKGIAVAWRPFLLGPVFRDLGWADSPFNLQHAKGIYMWRDLERTCAKLGLPFSRPEPFPQNSLLAARMATALEDGVQRAAFTRGVYRSQFADALSISDEAVLRGLLEDLHLDAAEILAHATTPKTKQILKDNTALARTHGIFGAPTWRTPDGELFWGNDRLEDALDWINA